MNLGLILSRIYFENTMNSEVKQKLIAETFSDLGRPGSYLGQTKLKRALELKGVKVSDAEIQSFLNKTKDYYRFRQPRKHSGIPGHISKRVTLISGPGLQWFADSLYFPKKGWFTVFKYGQLYVDAFSRKIYGRLIVKLDAQNSVKVLESIVRDDHENEYPSVIYCDRGSEYLSVYSSFLSEKRVKQVFTASQQKNKSYLAERAIRTLRLMLVRIHSSGERDLKKAFDAAIKTYNSTPHSLIKLTPDQAELPENFAKVYFALENHRYGIEDKYISEVEKLNSIYKINDLVRRRLPKQPLEKEATDRFSEEVYRISGVRQTEPLNSFTLSQLDTDIQLPGSFTVFDLIPANE